MPAAELTSQLFLLLPELALLSLTCVVLLADAFAVAVPAAFSSAFPVAWARRLPRALFRSQGNSPAPHGKTIAYSLTQATLALTAALIYLCRPPVATTAFSGHYIADPVAVLLKISICLIAMVALFYSRHYLYTYKPNEREPRQQEPHRHESPDGEYFVLALFATLGMLILVSANSMLTLYLGLELLSLSLYAMVAMRGDSPTAPEAAMKYFVLGALASGMLLYGISILYGVSGVLILPELAQTIAARPQPDLLLTFALVFVVVGVAFKLGAAPFHTWVPDVYEGAPTPVTLFIAAAPKIAAFALAARLLIFGLQPLHADWQGMLIVLSVLSMAAGNVIAIAQTNLKRMLAYSAIAHSGFLLLGILPGATLAVTEGGSHAYAGAMFYVLVYAVMSMGAFGMIILLGGETHEADKIDDFKGLAERSPWFAFIMLLLMFSLAGVPPFAGFWAKWFVLKEAVAIGHVWLAALAVFFSVIGAYYYLRVVKLMYFDPPERTAPIAAARPLRVMLSLNGLLLLVFGLLPDLLMRLCVRAVGVVG